MSELWHNGSVVFDRKLSDKEYEDITKIFADKTGDNGFYIGDFVPNMYADHTSCLDFDDYMTGRSGICDELEELVSYCKDHKIGIDPKYTLISFYGDDDGGYQIQNDEVFYLDRDELGAVNTDTGFLIAELESRGALPQPLVTVPTDDLLRELKDRKLGPERLLPKGGLEVFVVSSSREYENDECYYGPDAVFLSITEAYNSVLNDIKTVCLGNGINEGDEGVFITYGDDEFVVDWPWHHFTWRIDTFCVGDRQKEE